MDGTTLANLPALIPVTHNAFRPMILVDRLADAVTPLVSQTCEALKKGRTDDDVVRALMPVCEGYTVADAVLAIFLLEAAEAEPETYGSAGLSRSFALFLASRALVDFACQTKATGPECAAARANLLLSADGPASVALGIANERALRRMITQDIASLRANRFDGDLFGEPVCSGQLPQCRTKAAL